MIIITGASKGIGKFLLNAYIRKNEDVIAIFNKTEPTEHFNFYQKLDVTSEKEIEEFISKNKLVLKNISLVHCAGGNHNSITYKFNTEKFKDVINSNLIASFLFCKNLLPIMREEGYGRIIFFSSIVPEIGVPGTAAYSASKAGLWGLMKTIAKENANKNITCNTLNLGYFDIGMIKEVPEENQRVIKDIIPMKKFGDPLNILNAIEFIIASDYMTGSQIDINGGLH